MSDLQPQALVAAASHGTSFFAYATFAAILLFGGNRRGVGLYLILACIATAAWSGAVIASAIRDETGSLPELVLETLRSGAWIAFLYRLLSESAEQQGGSIPRLLRVPVLCFLGSIIAADVLDELAQIGGLASYSLVGRLIVPIIALTLIENLARNDWARMQWWARFLFVGVGGIFAYDLFLYSEALLFRRVNLELYSVRGAVDMIAVPLMAISFARNPTFAVAVHVSRQFVFHTMTLAGTGIYLLMMAIAGYYLRNFGGTWGAFFQIVFLSAALALVFVTLSSGRFRSSLRNFVSTHFFSYKYDYRHEWLQFIRLISAQESLLPLHDRVVQAIANIVDAPAGALWILRDDAFVNTSALNAPLSRETQRSPPAVVEWFETGARIAEVGATDGADAGGAPPLPAFLTGLPRAWLVVPLVHRHHLLGFLVLARPRAPRRLDAEDRDLLTTAGRQAASYIAEEEAGKALLDARQLELFNQRFAFVVHDIKNLVSQLSLILSNAERHGDNPEFQRDVLATVGHSVSRMKKLLEQLAAARRGTSEQSEVFDLAELVDRDWRRTPTLDARLHVAAEPNLPCPVRGEAETVAQVLRHVVQNALEAVGAAGHVEIALTREPDFGRVRVVDDGPGMTTEFIRDKLFRPFSTTKASGYGIGAYQARELIRRMGGRLEVASTPGEGTEVSIRLPIDEGNGAAARQVQEA